MPEKYTIEDVKTLSQKYKNWGKWGPSDQLGTLNYISPEKVIDAAKLVKQGKSFSLAIPFDDKGPQTGSFGRFNPIHFMLQDGGDIAHFPRGIMDSWSAFASGGVVSSDGFTPQQMARLAPSANIASSVVNVTVNNTGGRTQTNVNGTGAAGAGLNERDARDIARMVSGLVDQRLTRQMRSGGVLYTPRAG